MWRSKALCMLIGLCLCSSCALAQSDSLISQDMIKAETVHYQNTVTAQPGVYERSYSARGSLYYPHTYELFCETDNATFVEYTVARRQEVKKGDVLAVFHVERDEVALASAKLALENGRSDYGLQRLAREEDLQEMAEALAQTGDRYERELLTLRMESAKLSLEKYCYEQECTLSDLEKKIADMEDLMSRTTLVSPFDGVVTDLTYKRDGERVYNGEVLITLYRTDGVLLRIDNSNGYFRYGMDVKVEYGVSKKRTAITGRVVGADTMLPNELKRGYAYIELYGYDGNEKKFTNPSVSAANVYLDNVISLPKRAVILDGGKHYVSKLADGLVRKRFVNVALTSPGAVWVLQGVDAGDTLIME